MIKQLQTFILLLLLAGFIPNKSFAQFPYSNGFTNSTAPGLTTGGNALLTATRASGDTEGNGYLRLTSNANNQTGYAYVSSSFPSTKGISTSFEYQTWGGTGADGIVFFLFDATVTDNNFNVGAFGGSLGYSNNVPTNGTVGLSKGYLGVGLDEYGNFSNGSFGAGGRSGSTLTPNSVTIRGAWDDSRGAYYMLQNVTLNNNTHGFSTIGSGASRVAPGANGYRKAFIDIIPNSSGIGYNITVKIQHDGISTPVTIIDNLYYNKAAPANLKFGYSAGTGGSNNYHEVRNVSVTPPAGTVLNTPTQTNQIIVSCSNSSGSVDISSGFSTTNTPNGTINKGSVDLDPATSGIQTTYTVSKGTFTTDGNGNIIFTPVSSATGTASCSFTVADNYGATSAPATVTATINTAPTLTPSQTNVSCNGGSNGTATASPSGGTAPYTYSWSPSGGTGATASGLSAGTYTVTVTDANGCTASINYTITQPPALATSGGKTDVSTTGGSNGSATITPSGGTAPYTYSWLNTSNNTTLSQTTATVTGLTAGTYTVTATDANGCTITRSYSITQPTAAPVATTPANNSYSNNRTPTYTGTAAANSTVTVYIDGTSIGTTTATGSGNFSLLQPTSLNEGSHTIYATAQTSGQQISANSNTNTFIIDATVPTAPNVASPFNNSTTKDSKPSISGNAEAGSVVKIYLDGVLLTSANANPAAALYGYIPTSPLTEGIHTVYVTATDAAGNVSANSNTNTFTIDVTAPAPPIILTPANNSTSASPRLTISGTAEANSVVFLNEGNAFIGTARANASGNWTITPATAFATGSHSLTATAADDPGNISSLSNVTNFTILVPAPPANIGSGLVLWLDANDPNAGTANPANGSAVNSWKDKSGAGNDATTLPGQNPATYTTDQINGKSVMHFTRVTSTQGSVLKTPVDIRPVTNPKITVFSVYKQGTHPNQTQAIWGADNGFWDRFFMPAYPGDNGIVSFGPAPPYNTVVLNSGVVGETKLLTAVYDGNVSNGVNLGATNSSAIYFNGKLVTSFTDKTDATQQQTNLYIGWDGDDNTYNGDIAEMIVYNRKLTDCEILDVNKYLSAKYGVNFGSPTITVSGGNTRITNGNSVTLSSSAGASYQWMLNGNNIAGATNSTYSATKAGDYQVTVFNSSGCQDVSVVTTITVLYPPAPPVVTLPVNGSITNNSKPTISGTAEANANVSIYVDGVVITNVTADATGSYIYTLTGAQSLAQGNHTVKATATNADGTSGDSTPTTFTIDLTAPAIAIITTPANTAVLGNNKPTISGTAEANTTVTVYDGTIVIGTATTDATGKWSLTPTAPLSDGNHSITAKVSDIAGNASAASLALAITIDTQAPSVAVITMPATNTISGNNKPAISGTAEANSVITVYDGTVLIGTTTADANGKWRFTPTVSLAEGSHNITTTVTDAAGNLSAASVAVLIKVDTSAPAAPSAPQLAFGGTLTATGKPAISGTAEPGSMVTIYEGTTIIGTATTDAAGKWSITPGAALADGTHRLTAKSTDAAGNVGPLSSAGSFTIDTTAPAVPSAPTLASGGRTTGSSKPVINGTAEPGSVITLYEGSILIGTATADASGKWSITPTLAFTDGSHTLTVKATDAAGNVSQSSSAGTFSVSTVPTAAPSAPFLSTGLVISGNSKPQLSGNAEAGSTVSIYDGTTLLGTTVTDATGHYTFTPAAPLSDGNHNLTATAVNSLGNVSAPSSISTITIDTTMPAKSSLTIAGTQQSGRIDTKTPTISGTAEANSAVSIYMDGIVIATVQADSQGNWTHAITSPLTDGITYRFKAMTTDAAKNASTSNEIAVQVFVADYSKLQVANILTPNGDGKNDTWMVKNIELYPNNTVSIFDKGGRKLIEVKNYDNSWDGTFHGTPLAEGTYYYVIDFAQGIAPIKGFITILRNR